MTAYKNYNEFLLEEVKKKEFYRFVLNDIHIDIAVVIESLKDFNMSCWFIYNNQNSVSLEYFQKSDDSEKNIEKIKKFLFEKLPYFRDLVCHEDDKRLVLKFIEVGDPVRFKFYH